jgi:NADH dehydrogenase
MKIFITGSTGFVGRYIVNELCKEHYLFLPVRNFEKAQKVFKCKGNIELIPFLEDMSPYIKRIQPDVVINLLGILVEDKKKGITFEKVHFEYTKNLVNSVKEYKIKNFIQMSALGADKNSKSRYFQTKAKAEEYLINSNIEYTIFRPSIILGKEQKLFEDFKKFSKFTPVFLAPKDVKVQPVNIYDVRDCFAKAVQENPKNEIFELCGDKIITFKELFKFALNYIGKKRLVIGVPKKTFYFLSLFPNPFITKEQYFMMEKDNICTGKNKGIKEIIGKIRNPFEF